MCLILLLRIPATGCDYWYSDCDCINQQKHIKSAIFDSILLNWFLINSAHKWEILKLRFLSIYLGMHKKCNAACVCSFKINWIFRITLEMNSNNNNISSHYRIKQHRIGMILLKLLYCVGLFCMFSDWLCASVCLFSIALHLFHWLHTEYFFQFITRNRKTRAHNVNS